jgi:competence protein ComEA
MKNSHKHLSSSSTLPIGLDGHARFSEVMTPAAENYGRCEEELVLAETLKLPVPAAPPTVRQRVLRAVALVLSVVLAVTLYLLWQEAAPAEAPLASAPSGGTATALTPASAEGQVPLVTATATVAPATALTPTASIEVYIVGAVRHPGVYTLPAGARVYQLLQAAGGPLPEANLVALNLAAVLHDGEEIYVTRVGEAPPPIAVNGSAQEGASSVSGSPAASSSALVNINTASVDELRQQLHVSATTARNIVNYRLQHGPYAEVDQLLQVVSRSIYDRIKNLVTV